MGLKLSHALWIPLLLVSFFFIPSFGKDRSRTPMHGAPKEIHCLGRYLVDLPLGSNVSGRYKSFNNEIEVVRGETRQAYRGRVESREAGLRSTRHNRGGGMLVDARQYSPTQRELVSWFSEDSRLIHRYELFSYHESPNVTFVMSSDGDANRVDEMREFGERLARSIRYRASRDVPTDPGFCFQDGFMKGALVNTEEVAAALRVPGYPTVTLSYDSYVTGNPDKPLLSRVPLVPAMLISLLDGTSTLRRRDRNIGPIKGQELLVRASENGKRSYEFLWESQGQADSIEFPFMSLQLSTSAETDAKGDVIDAPFANDEEALAFWDAILGSVRIRPGAVGSSRD